MTVATLLSPRVLPLVLSLIEDETSVVNGDAEEDHGLLTSPLVTREILELSRPLQSSQYGLLGRLVSIHDSNGSSVIADTLSPLYINMNAPFSALVCGVQGSGKSHTVCTLLENAMIPKDARIGSLKTPLSGLVLHFGDGGRASLPCEAAALAASSLSHDATTLPNVTVYVSGSSLNTMKHIYSSLGKNVVVEPLKFLEDELDAEAFRSMMAVGSSESIPLYMHTVLNILRDLGERFTMKNFEAILTERKKDMNPMQLVALEQRMALLKSFMHTEKRTSKTSLKRFKSGQLTVVDLSDPFIDAAAAASLFEIVIRMFIRADTGGGKILVVDEAHKYLTQNASRLTKCIVTLIREQRHLGMRVVVSTQEPTVIPPVVLELCSVAILHRFASPAWFEHIRKHVPADLSSMDAFVRIVQLQTGEAIVLAPSGMQVCEGVPTPFVRQYLTMKTRKRLTKNLGRSLLANEK